MDTSSAHKHSNNISTDDQSSAIDELEKLRQLLVNPEQVQLAQLQNQISNIQKKINQIDPERLSDALPEAITHRSKPDGRLTHALTPIVENTLQASVKRDPQPLVDAIFPVIMPAIRKALSQLLGRMVQSFNEALEHSLSPQSVKWRFEALRTGKPFAEVVLLNTLRYRVEQVFLIHSEDGLLLQHVVADGIASQDGDMVSAMLTAIQDFVQDSFSPQETDSLQTLQVGELTVWLEQGPQAVLAGVIRGNAPQELRQVFQDTLEGIHLKQHPELEKFQGDSAPFEACRPDLEICLQKESERATKKPTPLLWAFLGIVIFGVGFWLVGLVRERQALTDYVNKLHAEPGIVVTRTQKRQGKYLISGLRDPLATEVTTLLTQTRLNPHKVITQWEPYQGLAPELVLARAKRILQPPETVMLRVEGDVLHVVGEAPSQWIVDTRKLIAAIAGITHFREENLANTDVNQLEFYCEAIQKQVVRFAKGATEFLPNQEGLIQTLTANLRGLDTLAHTLGVMIRVELVGHADTTGNKTINIKMSQERAEKLLSLLASEPLQAIALSAVGVGTKEPVRPETTETDRTYNRSVSFKVFVLDQNNSN